MHKTVLFSGSGLGVTHWGGADGDVLRYDVPTNMLRSEVPWAGVMVRGALRLNKYPDGVIPFTGAYGNSPDRLMDLPAGHYEYACEGETEYLCIGTVNALGRLTYEDFYWRYMAPLDGEVVDVEIGLVLMVAGGEMRVNGKTKLAGPQIIHADTTDIEVLFTAPGSALIAYAK